MQHLRSLEEAKLQESWVTIGMFDGVHLGHQVILHKLIGGAHQVGVPAVVITFHPHPGQVLGKRNGVNYLTLPDERAHLLGELGVDIVITLTFDRLLASLTAREFMQRLSHHLGVGHMVVGHDFALGRGREGNVAVLTQIGSDLGYSVEQAPQVMFKDEIVSSSNIRSWLAQGNVERAAQLLGRSYGVVGTVIHGDGRGRTIGIPTANLELPAGRAIPMAGVYACRVGLDGKVWGAVTNVGFRPTFENQPVTARVETHLLDFDRELYGLELPVEFIARLRDEQRFPGIQALVEQIHNDILRARQILNDP